MIRITIRSRVPSPMYTLPTSFRTSVCRRSLPSARPRETAPGAPISPGRRSAAVPRGARPRARAVTTAVAALRDHPGSSEAHPRPASSGRSLPSEAPSLIAPKAARSPGEAAGPLFQVTDRPTCRRSPRARSHPARWPRRRACAGSRPRPGPRRRRRRRTSAASPRAGSHRPPASRSPRGSWSATPVRPSRRPPGRRHALLVPVVAPAGGDGAESLPTASVATTRYW